MKAFEGIPTPNLWQVMTAPVLILFYTGLYISGSYGIILGLSILLLLGLALLLLVRGKPDDRGGWDEVNVP